MGSVLYPRPPRHMHLLEGGGVRIDKTMAGGVRYDKGNHRGVVLLKERLPLACEEIPC